MSKEYYTTKLDMLNIISGHRFEKQIMEIKDCVERIYAENRDFEDHDEIMSKLDDILEELKTA